jgi:hypothetical protein
MKPDLSQYEDAATLNKWFINNYPMGRIELSIVEINLDKGIVIFKGSVWRDSNDAAPAVTNFAKGERDEYPAHMRKWYLEDTATSCIARCLILIKGSNKTAPKESMIAATTWSVEPKPELERSLLEVTPAPVKTVEVDNLTELHCAGGSRMLYKSGISKTTNKEFAGYVCVCGNKCQPVWGSQRADGTWFFKETVNG